MRGERPNKENEKYSGSGFHKKKNRKLMEVAKIASSKAIRSSVALGLTYTIIRDRKVVAIGPDNTERVIESLPEPDIDLSGLKKGMVLKLKRR